MDFTEFSLIDMTPEASTAEEFAQPSKKMFVGMSARVEDERGDLQAHSGANSRTAFHAVYEAFDDQQLNGSHHQRVGDPPPKSRLQKRAELRNEAQLRLKRFNERKNENVLSTCQDDSVYNYTLNVERDTIEQSRRALLVTQPLHGASLSRSHSNESIGSIELMTKGHPQHHLTSLLDNNNGRLEANSTASTDDEDDQNDDNSAGSPSNAKVKRFGPLQVAIDQPFLAAMLVFIPLGIVSYFLGWSDTATFCLNFLAIVPQAWLIGKATEDLAAHLGQVLGGILNAWFGNIVEMLLCIAAIRAGELLVVKATLVGSILSNLLLVAGCSFLFGGFYHKVQEFSAIGASTNASLMTLSCLCLGLPTLYGTINPSSVISELNMSRSVSFFLIFMYIQYMIFQLYTHSFLFEEEDDEEEDVDLSILWAAVILGLCTVCCAANSEFLIHSIEGTVDKWNISKSFIGIILLPIIGNAAEHYTSVIVAMRNKMDLSLACAVGSSCQMALFVTPLTVLVGWACGVPMSLDLHAFEMAVLLLAVLIVTSILQDGYSNWLEGSMLVSAYFVIALMYFFENPEDSHVIASPISK